ncbi:transposase [Inquilinus sp. NPDC058860]|uniref:IS66-like element accessory protein TnpA n=1 Tax=Inquilinus sp. NPDC058860 TaxID=3346652 RepID=UPI0036996BF0
MSSSGRRSWSVEQKQRIIEATLVPGASVAEVARQHEVNANLVFKWLRQAGRGRGVAKRTGREGDDASVVPMQFVPLGVFGGSEGTAAASLPLAAPSERSASSCPASAAACTEQRPGAIEIALPGGAQVRVDAFVNQGALRRVLQALKELP